jgi:hypothetical protein
MNDLVKGIPILGQERPAQEPGVFYPLFLLYLAAIFIVSGCEK